MMNGPINVRFTCLVKIKLHLKFSAVVNAGSKVDSEDPVTSQGVKMHFAMW